MKEQLHVQVLLHTSVHMQDRLKIVLFSAGKDLVHYVGLFVLVFDLTEFATKHGKKTKIKTKQSMINTV